MGNKIELDFNLDQEFVIEVWKPEDDVNAVEIVSFKTSLFNATRMWGWAKLLYSDYEVYLQVKGNDKWYCVADNFNQEDV